MRISAWLAGCLLAGSLNAASFDCAKARTEVERLICSDPALSRLDEELDELYRAARQAADPGRISVLVSEQKAWLAGVRNQCTGEPCLRQAYASRIERIRTDSPATDDQPLTRTDFLDVHPPPLGKGWPNLLPSIDGDLVYSHYDDNGNTRSIVQFDFTTGRHIQLVTGKREPRLIAQDSRYIVFHTPHSASFPIEVMDRNDGRSLSRLRLKRQVFNAFIDKDRLVLFQGQASGKPGQAVAILQLPNLKLVRELSIPGGQLLSAGNNRIITAHSRYPDQDVVVYDRKFQELGRLTIPPRSRAINAACSPTITPYAPDHVLLTAHCIDSHVVNLKTFAIERTIPGHEFFHSAAVYEDLLFTAPASRKGIAVYDLKSGVELARLPQPASHIQIKGETLLVAGDTDYGAPYPVTNMGTYRINAAAIRSGAWRKRKVVEACARAVDLERNARDTYQAIQLCEDAGIAGLIDGGKLPEDVLPLARKYAMWLGTTLDRSRDAMQALDKLQKIAPDAQAGATMIELKLKTRLVEGEAIGELTAEERKTPIAQVLMRGTQLKSKRTQAIDYGSFSDLFHASGDRIYIGRYGCRECLDSVSIAVLDRASLEQLATIPIGPSDDDQQDAIASIASDENRLYVSVDYRYDEEDRRNFLVIDKQTLKVVREGHLKQTYKLFLEAGRLFGCHDYSGNDLGCVLIDPVELGVVEAPGKYYAGNQRIGAHMVDMDDVTAASHLPVAATRDFLLVRSGENQWSSIPRLGGSMVNVSRRKNALGFPVSAADNLVLAQQVSADRTIVNLVDASSGSARTLLGFPNSRHRAAVPLIYKNYVLVGYGVDLLVFDLSGNRLRRFVKDFVPAGTDNSSSALDERIIVDLLIDRDRLIALTRFGTNSQVIPLRDLLGGD